MALEKLDPCSAISQVKNYLTNLQNRICLELEKVELEAKFFEDQWSHHEGGGGLSRIMTDGNVIEKAGVNFSHIMGKSLPKAATEKRPELANTSFQALGVSTVIHPTNPFVPTTHMNVRFFLAETGQWWFGGGFDLTPYYGFIEDCKHWHQTAKAICDPFGENIYPKFKKWCDNYFFLKHRQEPRGIGGLFFDDINEWGFLRSFELMQAVGDGFIQAYLPILMRRKAMEFNAEQKHFQLYRRGRYVEFNLLYDRGTLFGLESGGRTESILMSLPPVVEWKYNWKPKPGSKEEELYTTFLVARDW